MCLRQSITETYKPAASLPDGAETDDDAIAKEKQYAKILEEYAQNYEAFGPGLFTLQAGEATEVSVQAPEGQIHELLQTGLSFTLLIESDELLYKPLVKEAGEGVYSAQYSISAPGAYSLSLLLNDEFHIHGSPFPVKIMPGPTVAKKCLARGEGLHTLRPGEATFFTIEARDVFGNKQVRPRASGVYAA